MRRLFATLLAIASSAVSLVAFATPRLDVAHVQGRDAPWVVGWNEAVITLDNADGAAWRGEVTIDASFDRHPDGRPTVRVPVSLAGGESARLLVPFHLSPGSLPNVVLRTAAEGEVASVVLSLTRPIETVANIVEIQGKEARGFKLVDVPPSGSPFEDEKDDFGGGKAPVPLHGPKHGGVHPSPVVPPSPLSLQVTTVQIARESGDPILADIAGGWTGAVLVLVPSDILTRLSGRPLEALRHWVLSGGTLGVAVTREEDLRSANLKTFVGVEARMTSSAGAAEMTFSGGSLTRGPGDEGEFTSHGLGEVWLLRRDPWARTFDAKSPKSLYALYGRARGRRSGLMSLPAGTGLRFADDDRVRKFLDPNHGFRPSLGAAALLVVAYALAVGPVAFGRARKLGRPLSVLRITPLLALVAFALLIGLGKVGKGIRGRARRLAVVDVAGGSTMGTATTFHAFYVSDPNSVEVVASREIDTVHAVEPYAENAAIDVDRGPMAVRHVRAHPWQTVVVAEEGGKQVPGGIVLEGYGQSLTLINKTPWTLEHVVLHPETTATSPHRSRYFAKVAPGATVVAHDGVAVDRQLRPMPWHFGPPGAGTPVLAKDDPALDAIDALDAIVRSWANAAYPPAQPIPYELPIATALVRSSSGSMSGLSIDREAMLIRVVGLGGGKGKGQVEKDEPKNKEQDL